jgi:hypothetical protein
MSRTLRTVAAAILVLGSLAAAVVLAGLPMLAHAGAAAWHPGEADGARLSVQQGLGILELSGNPARRGRQMAALVGNQGGDLLAVMRLNPQAAMTDQVRLDRVLAATRASDRTEIEAFAAATGLSADGVLLANATIETMCSAVAHIPSATVARNMDFFPPGPLGQATLVQIVREPGRHTYAAVGWPAMCGVISGMNDTGLSANILLNWKGEEPPPGEPLAFRVRAILQDCADVASGLAALGAEPVGSRHFVLLADAHDAAVAWWTPDGLRVDRPRDGWLVASNWIREGGAPRSDDRRGGCLMAACRALDGTVPDPAWFRRVVTASYMPMLNAQAMVFDHRNRRLELALASGLKPAALQPWRRIELGPLLDGGSGATAEVTRLPAETPMPHYLQRR